MKKLLTPTLIACLIIVSGCASPNGPSVGNNPQYTFQLISATITPGQARDVWVDGNTAFVADDDYSVTIWDVTDLRSPVMIDSISTLGPVQGISYSRETNLVFTEQLTSRGGVSGYDRGSKVLQINHGNGKSNGFKYKVISSDTLILVEVEPDPDGCQFLYAVREDTVGGVMWTSDVTAHYTPTNGFFNSLELDSNYVFFAHGQLGVSIIKYNTALFGPSYIPDVLGRVNTPGVAKDLVLSRDRNHLFVADNQSGLQVIDVTDKSRPRITGTAQPANVNDAIRVRALGDTAIFVEQYRGIYAVNCANPASPRYFGTYSTPDPQGLFIRESDKTVFLTDLDQGLLILKFR